MTVLYVCAACDVFDSGKHKGYLALVTLYHEPITALGVHHR